MNCNTTHYRANSSSVPGDPTPNHAFDDLPASGSGASNLTTTDSFTYTLGGGSIATVTITLSGLDSNDTLEGTAGPDTLSPGTGSDTVHALGGADVIVLNGDLDATDAVDGGSGTDTVTLNGDYSAGVTFGATTLVAVERIVLGTGFSYDLISNDATVAAGQTLALNGSALGAGDALTFNGAAETNGAFYVAAGAGANTLTGGAGADVFVFASPASFTAGDTIDGGAGSSLDRLGFVASGTFAVNAFANVSHIEFLVLGDGGANSILIPDALVASSDDGHILRVAGGTGDDTIDASAVSSAANRLYVFSGTGNDSLTGGAGADRFYFAAADLNALDSVDGGGSIDTLYFTTAGALAGTALAQVSHVERFVLAGGGNSLTLTDALVSSSDANHVVMVTGNAGNDTIDGSAVTSAANGLRLYAGTGNDTLTGGAGADVFYFATAALNGSDHVHGGTGAAIDTLAITTVGILDQTLLANVSHIEKIVYGNGGSHRLTLTDALVGTADDNHVLTVIGSTGAETINAAAVTATGNSVRFEGLGGADRFVAGAGADRFLYVGVADSTGNANGTAFDTIGRFDAVHDRIDLPNADRPTSIATVSSGNLAAGSGTFDSDMNTAIGGALAAHGAVLFHVTGPGSLHNHDFLVVNPTGTAGYTSGADYVFDITGYTGTITTTDFI